MPVRTPPRAGPAAALTQYRNSSPIAGSGQRITPRPSAEPIRVQRSDDNAAVIVVLGQKSARRPVRNPTLTATANFAIRSSLSSAFVAERWPALVSRAAPLLGPAIVRPSPDRTHCRRNPSTRTPTHLLHLWVHHIVVTMYAERWKGPGPWALRQGSRPSRSGYERRPFTPCDSHGRQMHGDGGPPTSARSALSATAGRLRSRAAGATGREAAPSRPSPGSGGGYGRGQ